MNVWQTELHSFLELVLGAPYGSKPFWITACIAIGVLLIFGWLITSFIFSAKRGFIIAFIGLALPGAAAIAGWIAVSIYAIPELNAGPVRDYLPLAGAIVAAFLTTMIASRFVLGITEGSTFLSVVLTYICVGGGIFLGGSLVQNVESGLEQLENSKEERNRESDSILQY